ncbi:MAG: LysR family transcriptional regulator [Salinisphaeraceae bacterium]|nr:LysR family transcriptional regulator [Salinisphaeraceae bacterium]
MDSTRPFHIFVRIFEVGSFSAVARELELSQSTVSKQLAALEAHLGVRLFTRTTRQLTPTNEAIELYESVKQMLDTTEVIRTRDRQTSAASGTLKLSLPGAFGRQKIIPILPEFLALYPNLSVDISLTDRMVDLVAEGIELAIRLGDLSSSSLVARRIGSYSQHLLASQKYIDQHGRPADPGQLSEHNCVVYGHAATTARWTFDSEFGHHAVDVQGRVSADDAEALYRLVCDDVGIGLVPDWAINESEKAGRVIRVLEDYYPPPQSIHAVFLQRHYLPQRVQSFLEFVTDKLKAN